MCAGGRRQAVAEPPSLCRSPEFRREPLSISAGPDENFEPRDRGCPSTVGRLLAWRRTGPRRTAGSFGFPLARWCAAGAYVIHCRRVRRHPLRCICSANSHRPPPGMPAGCAGPTFGSRTVRRRGASSKRLWRARRTNAWRLPVAVDTGGREQRWHAWLSSTECRPTKRWHSSAGTTTDERWKLPGNDDSSCASRTYGRCRGTDTHRRPRLGGCCGR